MITQFRRRSPLPQARSRCGMTLVELIVATTILLLLTTMALPLGRVVVQREREHELHAALQEIRDAIDRYKDAADRGAILITTDSQGYPPDLQTLVDGVQMNGKNYRFLRSIPMDPMTHSYEWGLRAVQDEPDSTSWGGTDVFDVYTTSQGTALNGSKYNSW